MHNAFLIINRHRQALSFVLKAMAVFRIAFEKLLALRSSNVSILTRRITCDYIQDDGKKLPRVYFEIMKNAY